METLGQLLKREREHKGISIEELAKITRIHIFFLRRMEQDDFQSLPRNGETVIRGFLKAYARELNLNVHELLNRYQTLRNESEPSKKEEPKAKKGFWHLFHRN